LFWLLIVPWARFAGYTSLSCSETWPPFTGENCDEARWFIIWPYTNISAPAADTGDVEPLARFTTSSRLFLGYLFICVTFALARARHGLEFAYLCQGTSCGLK
jgi:hypothetical protein